MDAAKLTSGKKTYKREVAVVMLAMLFAWWSIAMWSADTDQRIKLLEIMIYPVFFYLTAAYGMSTYQRQDDKRIAMEYEYPQESIAARYGNQPYDPSRPQR